MNLATYARRNLFRRRGRTILTIAATTMAVLSFCAIRTFIVAFNTGADEAAADRIATRHKVSITMQLPRQTSFLIEAIVLAVIGGVIGSALVLLLSFVSFPVINFQTFSEIVIRFHACSPRR